MFLCYARYLMILLFIVNLFQQHSLAGQNPSRHMTQAEAFVLERVSADAEADLREFSDKESRVLRATFLRELLIGSPARFKVQPQAIVIHNAVITGPLELTKKDIPFHISLIDCEFVGPIDFTRSTFTKSLSIYRSIFHSMVDFHFSKVSDRFIANEAKFQNGAFFKGIIVGSEMSLNRAVFVGQVDFSKAAIGGNFEAERSEFSNNENKVEFESIKVKGHALFTNTVFKGPVTFYAAEIGGNFEAEGGQFQDADSGADFDSIKVHGQAKFGNAVFEGPASFDSAEIGRDLEATQTQFKNPRLTANFVGMEVKGAIVFIRTFFTREPGSLIFGNMNYQAIKVGEGEDLISLIERAEYSSDAYERIEKYLRESGDSSGADAAYIAKKEREFNHLPLSRKILSGAHRSLAGYGRRPWQAIIWNFWFVLLGCWAFQPKNMRLQMAPHVEIKKYNCFWYSLGVFGPALHLKQMDIFEPRKKWVRFYWGLHWILGWLLIPVAVLAIAGIIK
jgi:hypothetical protein